MILQIKLSNHDFERIVAGEAIIVPVPGNNEHRVQLQMQDVNHKKMMLDVMDASDKKHTEELKLFTKKYYHPQLCKICDKEMDEPGVIINSIDMPGFFSKSENTIFGSAHMECAVTETVKKM